MKTVILGIPIDAVTRPEALSRIDAFLDEPRGHMVATPNPEMLVLATRSASFRRVLAATDLNVADGVGLVLASRLYGRKLPERVAGTDLVRDIAALAARRGRSVFLLGGEAEGVAADAAAELVRLHEGLRIAGAISGGAVIRDGQGVPRIDGGTLQTLQNAAPDVLFVAFGHGKQEEWIAAHLASLPSVRVAIGIGGAFDFIAGRVRRAPDLVRAVGLEWLWRLITQPWRIGRIATAVLTFPYLVMRERIGTITK